MNFKTTIILIFSILMLLILSSSCEDSLGLEDNYREWQINVEPEVIDTTMPMEIISFESSFTEYYPSNIDDTSFIEYPWGINISSRSFIWVSADSLHGEYYVSLFMNVTDNTSNDYHRDRIDRITNLSISVDSIHAIKTDKPDTLKYKSMWSGIYDGRYSSVTVESIQEPKTIQYYSYMTKRTSVKAYRIKRDIEIDGKIENREVIEFKIFVYFYSTDPVTTKMLIGTITVLV